MTRAVLLFLGLLALGIGFLAWLDAREAPIAGRGDGTRTSGAPPMARGTGGGPWISGYASAVQYDEVTGGRVYQFEAADSAQRPDGVQELRDVTVDLFEPEDDVHVARLTAASAEADFTKGGDLAVLDLPDEVPLRDVFVSVEAGTRFAPITAKMDSAVANLAGSIFRTDAHAEIRGTNIEGDGDGFVYDLRRGMLVFSRNGTVAVATDEDRVGRVASQNALTVEQPPGIGARAITIDAAGRALLGITGPEGLALAANNVRLVGTADPEREGSFRYEELVATGEVLLLADGNSFRCTLARFTLGADGKLERVRLVGAVIGQLAVPTPAGAGADGDEVLQRIDLWGQGPMELRAGDDGGFDLAGPAELRWRDTRLWAEGGLSGTPPKDGEGGPMHFEAWTSVLLERGDWSIRTENLEGDWIQSTDAGSSITLEADGQAIAVGKDRDGRDLRLHARSGFEIELLEDSWRVVRANGVDIEADGTQPFSATADVVSNFREDRELGPCFEASEHVEVDVGGQVLRGASLVAKGLEDVLVESASDGSGDLVTFDASPGVYARARSVRRVGSSLVATGDVSAKIDREDLKIDLEAATLDTSGLLDAKPGAPLRVHATGSVVSDFVDRETDVAIHVETEDLEIVRQLVQGSEVEQTVVRGRRGVVSSFRGGIGSYDLRSKELDALVVERRDEETPEEGVAEVVEREDDRIKKARGSVEARGDVHVVSIAPEVFDGHGDTFVVDHEGKGRLVALPGKRVSTFGKLPGTKQPFDVDASSIEFEPKGLRAVEPRIHVVRPLGDAAGDGSALVDLVATARQVRADEEQVVFEGDASFLGTTAKLETWNMRCARAVLTTDPPAADDPEGPRRPRDLVATGGVRVVTSTGTSIEGERLTATAFDRVVRVDGSPGVPAVFRSNGMVHTVEWVEYDTLTGLSSFGPGTSLPADGGVDDGDENANSSAQD
ncbi:MAG: hypothetical protein R3F34_15565 [Planctomycetota bacterium]